ncbi:sialin isoform X2 [Dendroctonus ponderosae]|nr:sialin isoform X2 [Dendroctonus ponderosae]KAH1025714.1 hypothetical protein HUJ05_010389 [Dendroctonus ponderosae]
MSNPSGSQAREETANKKPVFCCSFFQCRCGSHYFPQRIILALLLHLFMQNNFTTRVVLNVAIVEMVQPPPEETAHLQACPQFNAPNKTHEGGKFPWPAHTKSLVLYAFYIGYTFTQVPGGWLADKFGARPVILSSIACTTLATALFPVMTQKFGYLAAVGLRFMVGTSHGFCMPALSSLVSTWFPPKERPIWGGLAYAGTNLGTIMGNIISGFLIHKFDGWPVAFYFWSAYSGLFFLLVLLLLFSFPDTHPYISKAEADYIRMENSGNRTVVGRSFKTPWKAILLNGPYWANIAGQFGHNYIYLSLVTYLPTYMREILQFDVANDGYFAAIPFVALWIMSLIYSTTAPLIIKCTSERAFNSVLGAGSNVASAAIVLGAVYAACNRQLCIGLYIFSMIIKAFYYATLPVNINGLSRNYGGIMFGLCNALGSVSGIIGNFIIGALTKHKQLHEWRLAFWITFGVCVVTTVIFFLFSSTERQKFDYNEEELAEMQNS